MTIKLYSTHCPKCNVLEKKLTAKNLLFELIDDPDLVMDYAESHNTMQSPLLDVDGEMMDFSTAAKWVEEQ